MSQNLSSFEDASVVFVADMFRDEYPGGGELTTDALLQTSPYKTYCLKSKDLNPELIQKGVQKTWVFFNFREMDHNLIPYIVQNLYYYVVEYDYKFCIYRSLHLHQIEKDEQCDCHEQQVGKIVSTFFTGSNHTFFMSKEQMEIYLERFPFLEDNSSVLSSVFDAADLEQIESLSKDRDENNGKWAIVNGNSWIKGIDESVKVITDMGEEYELLSGLSYSDLLRKLSEFKGLVALPVGHDTCPRLVIEAKLLGLELIINENIQHLNEDWFQKDRDEIEMYLLNGHNRFWNKIADHVNRLPEISGYTQTYNVIESDYPWRESIESLLGFCDEVIVLDGGSTDGTFETLKKWADKDTRLIVKQLKRDWNSKRFALFDGQQKAAARTLCTKEWCWQTDTDEIVHEDDYEKVKLLLRQIPKAVKMISLPVTEFWGSEEKVRVDINPWKQRLSRNDPNITHGVVDAYRKFDEDGELYSLGSDGCDYIHTDTFRPIADTSFYTPDLHQVRIQAVDGEKDSLEVYEDYMNQVIDQLPGVYHYSWFDLKRKILTYKNYWSKHWNSLYNKNIEDTAENNMFFEKPWSDVTEDEINDLAIKMKEEMGGWIFHKRIDFSNPTPWMKINKSQPKIMESWIKNRGEK